MAERTDKKGRKDEKSRGERATPSDARPASGGESPADNPLIDPGQGTDLTQAGDQLYKAIRAGKIDPEDSTPKKSKKRAA